MIGRLCPAIEHLRRERGEALAEYSLVLAFVAAVCVIAVTAIGVIVVGFFTDIMPGFE